MDDEPYFTVSVYGVSDPVVSKSGLAVNKDLYVTKSLLHKFILEHFLTYLYLCGTTTSIWLRPDQEDLSMPACLEHKKNIQRNHK
jgi:hypothetical protein